VFISCLTHLEVLLTQIVDGRLVLLLKLLNLNCCINNVSHRLLNIRCFFIQLVLSWDSRCFGCFRRVTLPIHQDLKILVEFFRVLETLEDIVSVNESFGATIHCIIELKMLLFGLRAKLSFIELNVQLLENQRDKVSGLIANFTKAK
jgi:hypothetical protein